MIVWSVLDHDLVVSDAPVELLQHGPGFVGDNGPF